MSKTENTPDVWSRLWRTIRHLLGMLLRVLFVIAVAVLLAVGIYFGVPWVYRQLIRPMQSSATQITLLQSQVNESSAQWTESFSTQQQRITDLESQLAAQGQRIASLEANQSRVDETLAEQQAALDELSSTIDAVSNDYASLEDVETLRDEFATLQEDVILSEQVAAQIDTLAYRIVLVQAWQEVLKARLYLIEGNMGSAETMLTLSMTHLDQAAALDLELELEKEREAIATVQAHLTRATTRLREQPIIAAQDLESAWYELDALITVPEQ